MPEKLAIICKYIEYGYSAINVRDKLAIGLDPWKCGADAIESGFKRKAVEILSAIT